MASLREQFRGDLRQRRLEARDQEYRRRIPDLYLTVKDKTGPKWEKAKDVAAEVMKRHAEIFPRDAPLPVANFSTPSQASPVFSEPAMPASVRP
jgi:hypothetical protein